MSKNFKKLLSILTVLLLTISFLPLTKANAATTLGSRLLVGYWHNFDNGTGIIKLKDVSDKWDVLNVSFGETSSDRSVVEFTPCYNEADFIADVKLLQSKGKKVVLSIGGQNGIVLLPDAASKTKFVNSISNLVTKYGFDGLDIDLETGMVLNPGDTNFKSPTTPQITNLIAGIKDLSAKFGPGFVVSMAPETVYVQGGLGT